MKKIVITFQKTTPESVELGDYSETGWEDEVGFDMEPDEIDLSNGVTAVDNAVEFLKNRGAFEPSSGEGNQNTFYSTVDPDVNYQTGENTYYSFHLCGFSDDELKKIYYGVGGKK